MANAGGAGANQYFTGAGTVYLDLFNFKGPVYFAQHCGFHNSPRCSLSLVGTGVWQAVELEFGEQANSTGGTVDSDVLNPRALEGHERNLSTEEFITQRVGRTISQQ